MDLQRPEFKLLSHKSQSLELAISGQNPELLVIQEMQPRALQSDGKAVQRRKRKAPTKTAAEWATVKSRLEQLYLEDDMDLADVMLILENEEHFTAT